MKKRSKVNGNDNNNWETPIYIYDYLRKYFFGTEEIFDPCPLNAKFDGLKIDWKKNNYINPPYSRKLKEAFIRKAIIEGKKGNLCIMLIPSNVDTQIFHDEIVPNAIVQLIKGRVKFKGYNTKGEYVEDKTGQSGSMFVIFGLGRGDISSINIKED